MKVQVKKKLGFELGLGRGEAEQLAGLTPRSPSLADQLEKLISFPFQSALPPLQSRPHSPIASLYTCSVALDTHFVSHFPVSPTGLRAPFCLIYLGVLGTRHIAWHTERAQFMLLSERR